MPIETYNKGGITYEKNTYTGEVKRVYESRRTTEQEKKDQETQERKKRSGSSSRSYDQPISEPVSDLNNITPPAKKTVSVQSLSNQPQSEALSYAISQEKSSQERSFGSSNKQEGELKVKYGPTSYELGSQETRPAYDPYYNAISEKKKKFYWLPEDRDLSNGATMKEAVPDVFGVGLAVTESWTEKDNPFLVRAGGYVASVPFLIAKAPEGVVTAVSNPRALKSSVLKLVAEQQRTTPPQDLAKIPGLVMELATGEIILRKTASAWRGLKYNTEIEIQALEDSARLSTWSNPKTDLIPEATTSREMVVYDPTVSFDPSPSRLIPENQGFQVGEKTFQTQLVPDRTKISVFDQSTGTARLPEAPDFSTSELLANSRRSPVIIDETPRLKITSEDVLPSTSQATLTPLPEVAWSERGLSVVNKDSPFGLMVKRGDTWELVELKGSDIKLDITGESFVGGKRSSDILNMNKKAQLQSPDTLFDNIGESAVEWIEQAKKPRFKASDDTLSLTGQSMTPAGETRFKGVIMLPNRQESFIGSSPFPQAEKTRSETIISTKPAQEILQPTRTLIDQGQDLGSFQTPFLDQGQGQSSGSRSTTIQLPIQETSPLTETATATETAFRSRSPLRSQTTIEPFRPVPPLPRRQLYQELNNKLFVSEVKSRGVFYRTGSPGSFDSAFSQGLSRVKDTASASFRIIDLETGSVTKPSLSDLPKGFRLSKVSSSTIVQKRGFRIGSPGEKREITYKGIWASKKNKKNKKGFLLWA